MTTEQTVQLLNPEARRKDQTFLVQLPSGSAVRCKKVDIKIAILEGFVPMPLLSAMGSLVGQREMLAKNPARILSMPESERKAMLEVLRRYAVHAVIEPKLTLTDDADAPAGTMSVHLLDMDELTAIWAAVPVPTTMSESDAESFRREEPAADGPPAPDGGEVRDQAEQVVEDDGRRLAVVHL